MAYREPFARHMSQSHRLNGVSMRKLIAGWSSSLSSTSTGGNSLQNPVSRPTAKQLQSSLKETDKTLAAGAVWSGVRVFMLSMSAMLSTVQLRSEGS